LIDLLAVIIGAVIIFALFGFASLQKEEEDKIVEETYEEKIQAKALREAGLKEGEKLFNSVS
jgi:predicted cation transporter